MATKTVTDISNSYLAYRHTVQSHPLEAETEIHAEDIIGAPTPEAESQWIWITTTCQSNVLYQVGVYLGEFISFIQGGPTNPT